MRTRSAARNAIPPSLPNEIILQIASYLVKADLKSARLVTRQWSLCAAPSLFDQVYISPAQEDLEVFAAISKHQLHSKSIRQLIYDCSEFSEKYSMHDWFNELWWKAYLGDGNGGGIALPANCGLELRECFQDIQTNRLRLKKAWGRYKRKRFVSEGFQMWRGYALRQRKVQEDGSFMATLTSGLKEFSALRTVSMACWPVRDVFGSPLGRCWKSYHPKPLYVLWRPHINVHPNGARQYSTITKALARSERQVECFNHGTCTGGVPAYVFCTRGKASTGFDHYDFAETAFTGLKSLTLKLSGYGERTTPRYVRNLNGLQELLGTLEVSLEDLHLTLPVGEPEPPLLFNHYQVFPRGIRWPKLMSFSISGLSIGALSFINLVLIRMPRLIYLCIEMMVLSSGTWQWVLEFLSHMKHLPIFRIGSDPPKLLHRGGYNFLEEASEFNEEWDEFDLIVACQEYVSMGLEGTQARQRHPCLRSGEPKEAAERFMDECHVEFGLEGRDESDGTASDSFDNESI